MAATAVIEQMWKSAGARPPAPKEAWTRSPAMVAGGPRPPAAAAPTWAGRLRQQQDADVRCEAAERRSHESFQMLTDSFQVVLADAEVRTVDETGLSEVLALLGMPMDLRPILREMKKMRPDAGGRVGLDGFSGWYIRSEKQRKVAELGHIRESFELLDRDGSGALDKREVGQLSARLGTRLKSIYSSKKLNTAFEEMDPNGDGRVTFEEFRDWWMKRRALQEEERGRLLSGRLATAVAKVEDRVDTQRSGAHKKR